MNPPDSMRDNNPPLVSQDAEELSRHILHEFTVLRQHQESEQPQQQQDTASHDYHNFAQKLLKDVDHHSLVQVITHLALTSVNQQHSSSTNANNKNQTNHFNSDHTNSVQYTRRSCKLENEQVILINDDDDDDNVSLNSTVDQMALDNDICIGNVQSAQQHQKSNRVQKSVNQHKSSASLAAAASNAKKSTSFSSSSAIDLNVEELDDDDDDAIDECRNDENGHMEEMIDEGEEIIEDDEEESLIVLDEHSQRSNVFSQPVKMESMDYDELLDKLQDKVYAPPFVYSKLMPHQKYGVYFMWNQLFKNQDQNNNYSSSDANNHIVNGCILADFMGLGKTIQVVTLANLYLSQHRNDCILILSPASVCQHWDREFTRVRSWIAEQELDELDSCKLVVPKILGMQKSTEARLAVLEQWKKEGQVLICTYDMYRSCVFSGDGRYYEYLVDPGPDIIILDEGHKIKHMNSQISKALNRIACTKRIIMTGYPLQNNLREYYCMINFALPGLLGSPLDFKMRYEKPIARVHNGSKCTPAQKKQARRRAWMLHEKVKPVILRRDVSLLKEQLPEKHEIILNVRLSAIQHKMYKKFIELVIKSQRNSIFWCYNVLTMLCNHPDVLYAYYLAKKKEIASKPADTTSNKLGSSKSEKTVVPQSNTTESLNNGATAALIEGDDTAELLSEEAQLEMMHILETIYTDREINYVRGSLESSGKMVILYSMIFHAKSINDKLVVFSRSINTLNFIQASLTRYNKQKSSGERINFLRFDGSTSLTERQQYIDQFNDKQGDKHLLLVSTLAGGEGINLSSANRIILVDVNWNPSHDCEACCRVYRIGQEKPVYIYRLITQNTIEDLVHQRQIKKELLASWVVDDGATDVLNTADTKKLFTIPDEPSGEELEPEIDGELYDTVLANIMTQFPKWISKVGFHDDLLAEDPTNILSEEDKQLAKGEEQFDSIYGEKTRTTNSSSKPKSSNHKKNPVPVQQPQMIAGQLPAEKPSEEYQAELQEFLISELTSEEEKRKTQVQCSTLQSNSSSSAETAIPSASASAQSNRNPIPASLVQEKAHLYSLIDDEVIQQKIQSNPNQSTVELQTGTAEYILLEKEKNTMAQRMAMKALERKRQKDGLLPAPSVPVNRKSTSNNTTRNTNNRSEASSWRSPNQQARKPPPKRPRKQSHSSSSSSPEAPGQQNKKPRH